MSSLSGVRERCRNGAVWRRLLLAGAVALGPAVPVAAQSAGAGSGPTMDVYGFVMTDFGYQLGQNDANYFDVMRPTKLPAFEDQYGHDGRLYFGVRQSRMGVRANLPTDLGTVHTLFEFNLFGSGADVGQTTFRLRHAYAEVGKVGFGQTWSVFMDNNVFPNTVEYWGPNGLIWFRNIQIRFMPVQGDTRFTVALEKPGATGDQGLYTDLIELQDVRGRFPWPDVTAEYRVGTDWGYVELAGLARYVKWEDMVEDAVDLNGSAFGWGLNLSSNINLGEHVLRFQTVYGEGISNYVNDSPVDLAPRLNTGDPDRPIEGELLPLLGVVTYLDLNWTEEVSTAIGYSIVDVHNSSGQADDAYSRGHYASVNLLFRPSGGVLMGPEIIWGRRENFRDDYAVDDWRFQFSAKYNFSYSLEEERVASN